MNNPVAKTIFKVLDVDYVSIRNLYKYKYALVIEAISYFWRYDYETADMVLAQVREETT